MSFFQIGDVLQYDNSTKWFNEEISGVVTQVKELCTLFDKKIHKGNKLHFIYLQI